MSLLRRYLITLLVYITGLFTDNVVAFVSLTLLVIVLVIEVEAKGA